MRKKEKEEDNRGNKIIVFRWNDNTPVIEASNVHGDNSVLKSMRYIYWRTQTNRN